MNPEEPPIDSGWWDAQEAADAQHEAELGPFKYDPLARSLNFQRIREQGENDDAVLAQQNREAALTADRRDRLRWALGFIDSEPRAETSWDAIREGRA